MRNQTSTGEGKEGKLTCSLLIAARFIFRRGMSIDNFDNSTTSSNGSGGDGDPKREEMSEITTAAFLNKGSSQQFK